MLNVVPFVVYLLKKKIFIILNSIIAIAIAIYYGLFVVVPQFSSEITFFPPKDESGTMSLISGALGLSGASSGGDIIPQQIEILFYSNKLRKKFIDKLDLYEKYNFVESPNPFVATKKILVNDLTLSAEELGNLGATTPISFRLTYFHTDKDSARLGVEYMYHLLDSSVKDLTTNLGKARMQSVEKQLKRAERKRDSLQYAFHVFQKENRAYDVPKQVEKSIELYAELKQTIFTKEMLLEQYKSQFSMSHPSILSLQSEINNLKKREGDFIESQRAEVFGGLNNTSSYLSQYGNFRADIEAHHKMVLFLSQQYESARLKATYDLSPLRLIDPAITPDYKTRPSRAKLMILIFAGYMLSLFSLLIIRFLYKEKISKRSWFNEIKTALTK